MVYTCNHLPQERGLQLTGKFDMDEETKYSSVCPADGFDDTDYEEEEDILLNCCNNLTFGDSSASGGKVYEESWVWFSSSLLIVSRRTVGDFAIFRVIRAPRTQISMLGICPNSHPMIFLL